MKQLGAKDEKNEAKNFLRILVMTPSLHFHLSKGTSCSCPHPTKPTATIILKITESFSHKHLLTNPKLNILPIG